MFPPINNKTRLSMADLNHVIAQVGDNWEKVRGQKIFLTGGTGFVGRWLLETLLEAASRFDLGCHVTVLSRCPEVFIDSSPHLNYPPLVSFLAGDVRNFPFPSGRYDFVIHAATDVAAPGGPLDIFTTCVEGTKRVLEFARQAKTQELLLVSSGAVYGQQPVDLPAIPETYSGSPALLDLRSAYGEGKRGAEWLSAAYTAQYDLSAKIARCFAFVGPHLPLDKHFAIGNFIRDAMTQCPIVIQGDGTPLRTYLYAADLAIWLWTILFKGVSGTAYNVGGNEVVSIENLARRIVKLTGSRTEVKILKKNPSGKIIDRYVPDVTKAEAELGLRTFITLDESIIRTIQWHQGVYRS